ncbi:MAG: hypothetical protein H6975_04435 [Gammaproteobacteria bacterium]|nr:hypothetical protein [Gammaproteobacteria bacterium]
MFQQSGLPNSSTAQPNRQDGSKTRFITLWLRCVKGSKSTTAETIHDRLLHLYGEAHRHYHTLDHIQHCLQEFDQAATRMDDPHAVEIALWFHDAIYEPGAKDNEQRSAELFQKYSNSSGCTDMLFQRRIHDLIMVTTHREQPSQPDEQFIVDIDLSSFGLPWDRFEQDGQRIRAECAGLSDDEYYPGHVRFLQALWERPTFFFTDFFQKRYEQTARENIARLITSLHLRGYY